MLEVYRIPFLKDVLETENATKIIPDESYGYFIGFKEVPPENCLICHLLSAESTPANSCDWFRWNTILLNFGDDGAWVMNRRLGDCVALIFPYELDAFKSWRLVFKDQNHSTNLHQTYSSYEEAAARVITEWRF